MRPHHKKQFHQMCLDLTGLKTSYKPEDSVNKKRLREETGSTDTGLSDFQCDIKLDEIQFIIAQISESRTINNHVLMDT